MNTSNLKRSIMLRIYMIFIVRKLKSPLFLKLAVLTLLFISIGSAVSLESIIANTPHNPMNLYNFGKDAFWNTQLSVKIITLLAAMTTIFLIKDIPNLLQSIPKPRFIWRA